jgi:hypothetical protein
VNRLRVARLASLVLITTTLSVLPFAGATAAPATDHATHQSTATAVQAGKGRGKVSWSSTTYNDAAPAKITAQGKLKRKGKHKVMLQVKIPHGWRTFAKSKSKKSGSFRVAGTLKWFGTHKVRVHSGRFNKSKKVHVQTSWTPRGKASWHTFIKNQGRRWVFNPCQTVRYKVNAADVGPAGLELAKMAMEQVAWATGTKVKYKGTTKVVPWKKKRTKLPRGTDLVIAWAGADEVKAFDGPVGGVGGPLRGWTGRTATGQNVWKTTTAGVTINSDDWFDGAQYPAWDGPSFTTGGTLLHEIAHAFGLNHVKKHADQLMYPSFGLPDADGVFRARYSAGDLAGMQKSGLQVGCVRKVYRRTARVGPVDAPLPLPLVTKAG